MTPRFKVGDTAYFYNGSGYFFSGLRDHIFGGTIERVQFWDDTGRIEYILNIDITWQKDPERIWIDESLLMTLEEATAKRLRS